MVEQVTPEAVLNDACDRMNKSVRHFRREIAAIRTGRATPDLLDGISIEYFGSRMHLNQLATVSAPEPRLITVQPWDRSAIAVIEKEIQRSDLGLTPNNDGTVIRLPIPPLTEERRRELVRRLRKLLEATHVAIRNIRRDNLDYLRRAQKGAELSEDGLRRAQERLQKITNEHVAEADRLSAAKERDLLEV